MKLYRLFLLAMLAAGLAACSGDKGYGPGCHVDGHTSFGKYPKAYLIAPDRSRVDSVDIADGHFRFLRIDSLVRGEMAWVRLQAANDFQDWLEMPVVVEEGTVRLEIGDYVYTSGTPQNKGMQAFLDGLQRCKDSVTGQLKVLSTEEIRNTFSAFYKEQILSNKGTALGRFIQREYGSRLTPADLEQVKAETGL